MFAIEKSLLLLLPVLAVLLAKCGSSGSSGNNAGERTTMSGWKTMPVGRMLIDVPNEAVISFREDKIWATVLAWEPELTPGQAVAEARQKETAYRQVKATQEGQSPTMFRNMVPLANGGLGVHHWTKIYDTYSAYTTDIDCYFITPPPNGRVFRYIYGGIGAEPAVLVGPSGCGKQDEEPFGNFPCARGRRNADSAGLLLLRRFFCL